MLEDRQAEIKCPSTSLMALGFWPPSPFISPVGEHPPPRGAVWEEDLPAPWGATPPPERPHTSAPLVAPRAAAGLPCSAGCCPGCLWPAISSARTSGFAYVTAAPRLAFSMDVLINLLPQLPLPKGSLSSRHLRCTLPVTTPQPCCGD